ncbi:hypothetical protein MHU86_8786 [Fragilaria crotonensis]|nr:hypothetical protein MHU86_8786 [Fragilaria crotonensis]
MRALSRGQISLAFLATVLSAFIPIMISMGFFYALVDFSFDEYAKGTAPNMQECPPITELKPAASEGKNLVAFVALGAKSSVATVHHNVHAHFLGWDCIVFVHTDESEISPNNPLVKEIGSKCSIVRLPGLYWIHFLMTLTPELAQHYEYIAIVLDDLFAPVHGDTAVSMPKLLQQMQQFNLSSISPSIKGAAWPSTKPQEPCLWLVHHLETFFQIFTRDLFICWHSFMHFSNHQGWCLDVCLEQRLCPFISRLAVDGTMVAYHLGQQERVRDFVPESALVGVNLTDVAYRTRVRGDIKFCRKMNCSRFWISDPEQLQCNG